MDGTESASTKKVLEFREKLGASVKVPMELWDERLTTREVERMLVEQFDVSRKKRRNAGIRSARA